MRARDELLPKLRIWDKGGGLVAVMVRSWIPSADWDELNIMVEQIGGTWVRDVKFSRWEVQRGFNPASPEDDVE